MELRTALKKALGALPQPGPAQGATLLIYHRIGGGTKNELDLPSDYFERQLRILANHEVLSLDESLNRLDSGTESPTVVLTFDDGFEDVYDHAWPLLRGHRLPFTLYLATAYVGSTMRWEGSAAKGAPANGLSWAQISEMVDSGLCTIGNHTHTHVRPRFLTAQELDECTDSIQQHLGVTPRHFTYPWGAPVPEIESALRERFRSASTGLLGRNTAATDRMRLSRVPVRRSDPDSFFAAKLRGGLEAERAYAALVGLGKAIRALSG